MKKENKLPSNRIFGLFFTCVFLIVGIVLYEGVFDVKIIILVCLATLIFIISLFAPNYLIVLNKTWMHFGLIINSLISPIILSIIYFCLFSPIAIGMRIFGRDELLLKKTQQCTFWKLRKLSNSDISSFKNQY
jgi:hypothetical protein